MAAQRGQGVVLAQRQSGAWTAHARYLARPGAQQELTRGLGFDAEREQVDLMATVKGWEKNDELMWRFIVSPEDADRLDLRDHVRELVGRMERDLESKLEWVAIDHHNTDDAHVHLLVRGVRDNARPLEIDREYLRSGHAHPQPGDRHPRTWVLGSSPRCCARANVRSIACNGPKSIAPCRKRPMQIVSFPTKHFEPRSEGARIRAEQEIARLHFPLTWVSPDA